MVIDHLARQYVASRLARREIVRKTAIRQRSVLRGFAVSFGRRAPKNMGAADIERWMVSRRGISTSTMRQELVTVRGFVTWLRREGHLFRDPMRDIRNPRLPRSVPRSLTQVQVASLLAVLPDARANAIVMLMLGLGLRRAEVARLQCGDWDQVARTLHVVGKGDHERLLPVPARVATALDEYRVQVTAGHLIRRLDGRGPLTTNRISELMQTWMTAAGIKRAAWDGKACHSLRHTLASEVADVEPDLRVLQQILGHVNLTSTQIYIRGAEMTKLRVALECAA